MLSIDCTNFVINTRNDRIAEMAEKFYGRPIAQIARAACLQVDGTNAPPLSVRLTTKPEAWLQPLDLSRLSSAMSNGLSNGDSKRNGVNGNHVGRINGSTGEDRVMSRYLRMLAEGPFTFVVGSEQDPDMWNIDRSKLNEFLWDKEMHRLIDESLAEPALRIVRMLADRGKLEEKTMQELGLLNSKELRKCLAALQTKGFLEIQEVPKDPQRQPKSTIFLYFYDAERLRRVLLDRLYKAMSRIYQRMHLEREEMASTLNKVEDWDEAQEAEHLVEAELEALNQWRQKESWFLTEIHRIDDSIAILRDI
jgi:DNA-directed RNA polymerase III subunit RPC3